MTPRQKHLEVYYLGGLLLIAMILGGGASKFLYTEFILQLLILPAAIWSLYQFRSKDAPYLPLLLGVILGATFLPIVFSLGRPYGVALGTVDLGRSLGSAVFVIAVLAVFCFALLMEDVHRARVAQFFLVAVAINMALSLSQFLAARPELTLPGFSFNVSAGFFESETHFSALCYVAIAFVILAFKNTQWWFLSVPLALAIALYQFLIGQTAGVLVGLICLCASLALTSETKWIKAAAATAAFISALSLALFVPDLVNAPLTDHATWLAVQSNTLAALGPYLPLGSGYGTFSLVYPAFGSEGGSALTFPAHAQNDLLQVILEGGIIAVALILAYLAGLITVCVRSELSDFQKMALLGILILLAHSAFGYPLRTLALVLLFAYLNAVLFGPFLRTRSRTGPGPPS